MEESGGDPIEALSKAESDIMGMGDMSAPNFAKLIYSGDDRMLSMWADAGIDANKLAAMGAKPEVIAKVLSFCPASCGKEGVEACTGKTPGRVAWSTSPSPAMAC